VFKSIKKVLDRSLELLVIVIMASLVVDVLWQVFTRFAPRIIIFLQWFLKVIHADQPSTWTEELARILLIWVSLLGASVALGRGAHLGIDYFVGKLLPRKKLFTEFFVFLAVAAFSLCVMVVGGSILVIRTLDLGQTLPAISDILGVGVKMGYVYLAVPISGFFMVLYSVIGLVERIVLLSKDDAASTQPPHVEEGID
jgi:TRAP-type C4-dicarboxylate transport system permease small subunit